MATRSDEVWLSRVQVLQCTIDVIQQINRHVENFSSSEHELSKYKAVVSLERIMNFRIERFDNNINYTNLWHDFTNLMQHACIHWFQQQKLLDV